MTVVKRDAMRNAARKGADHVREVKQGERCLMLNERTDDAGIKRVKIMCMDGVRGWVRDAVVKEEEWS